MVLPGVPGGRGEHSFESTTRLKADAKIVGKEETETHEAAAQEPKVLEQGACLFDVDLDAGIEKNGVDSLVHIFSRQGWTALCRLAADERSLSCRNLRCQLCHPLHHTGHLIFRPEALVSWWASGGESAPGHGRPGDSGRT